MLTFGSLFAGIGGMDLGLERAGMVCRWQVEIDEYCRRVLTKHWPDVPKYGDIREVTGGELEAVDLICGGFPCQDISGAGERVGIDGARSGLWSEYIRLVRFLRPRFVLVDNVADLLVRGAGRVLGDLASGGYDAEWDCIPAASVGAHHLRDRAFIVAYANGKLLGQQHVNEGTRRNGHVDYSQMAHADRQGLAVGQSFSGNARKELAAFERGCRTDGGIWELEPGVGRVANGVPNRIHRLRGLGNAVVPQVAEWIGRRILESPR
jgi:DNA (cytosine-5)-methyltransferase 1